MKNRIKLDTKTRQERNALFIGLILVVVFFASFGSSFARYRSATNITFGTAGIATYAVSMGSEESKNLAIDLDAGDSSVNYNFWIKNTATGSAKTTEVSLVYRIMVKLGEAIPEALTIELVDDQDGSITRLTEAETILSKDGTWIYEAGAEEETRWYTLRISANPEAVTEEIVLSDINIIVFTEQMD